MTNRHADSAFPASSSDQDPLSFKSKAIAAYSVLRYALCHKLSCILLILYLPERCANRFLQRSLLVFPNLEFQYNAPMLW